MFEAAERGGASLDPSPWCLVVAPVATCMLQSRWQLGVMNENILSRSSVQCSVSSVQVQCPVLRDIKIAQRYTPSRTTTAPTLSGRYSLLTIAYIQTSIQHQK